MFVTNDPLVGRSKDKLEQLATQLEQKERIKTTIIPQDLTEPSSPNIRRL